jgi:hypothetical protein
MKTPKRHLPKKGDRVSALGQNGAFVISQVNSKRRTAELKLIGPDFTLRGIPWGVLTFLDELGTDQNSVRIAKRAS